MIPMDELDAARARWDRKHRELGLPLPNEHDVPKPRGLATKVEELSTRIVVLPRDPFSTDLSFDEEFWSWWSQERPSPFGSSLLWHGHRPTADAAVKFRSVGETWSTYLALHRHGGGEVGTGDAYVGRDEVRYFRFGRTVALLWLALGELAGSFERFQADGPWEVLVAFHGTSGAHLGDVGKGWAKPTSPAWDAPRCTEPNVVLRRELPNVPTERDAIRVLALDFGNRIEDAWGVKASRVLDREGAQEGRFYPRYLDL